MEPVAGYTPPISEERSYFEEPETITDLPESVQQSLCIALAREPHIIMQLTRLLSIPYDADIDRIDDNVVKKWLTSRNVSGDVPTIREIINGLCHLNHNELTNEVFFIINEEISSDTEYDSSEEESDESSEENLGRVDGHSVTKIKHFLRQTADNLCISEFETAAISSENAIDKMVEMCRIWLDCHLYLPPKERLNLLLSYILQEGEKTFLSEKLITWITTIISQKITSEKSEKIADIFIKKEEISEGDLCIICFSEKKNFKVEPCQHEFCETCLNKIISMNQNCSVCRGPIEKKVRIL